MQQVAGIAILLLYGICIWGLIDVVRQINKLN
jgi:hypothetical protein